MEINAALKSRVKQWIASIFKDELRKVSVELLGTSEKGDGYLGDIIFARVNGIDGGECEKEIEVVLKCSKGGDKLREKLPVGEAFLNEIYVYESIFPAFRRFERSKGIRDPFDNVPKFYGKFTTENMEVIVFENLKRLGYDLWNRRTPMPKEYLRSVLQAYAKFHAVSIAMQDQVPEKFHQLTNKSYNIFGKFCDAGSSDFAAILALNVELICNVLRGDVDNSLLDEWRILQHQSHYLLTDFVDQVQGVKVVTHSDCWCNNFMFIPPSQTENQKPKVAVIDWQISWLSTPILDLSYFLFCSISKDDLPNLDDFLLEYHRLLSERIEQLGSNANLYPRKTFLDDWRKYCKFGLLFTSCIIKICLSEKDEVPELKAGLDNESNVAEEFVGEIRNMKALKERILPLIKYAVEHDLIRFEDVSKK